MIEFGIPLKDKSTGLAATGLVVKLVNPGDNWSSGDNTTLAEVGITGYYFNDAIDTTDEGYKEIWTDESGTGADSGIRSIMGHNNQVGTSMDGSALNKEFGDDPDDVPDIYAVLATGKLIYGFLHDGIIKLRSSTKGPDDLLDEVKTVGYDADYIQRKFVSATGVSVIGVNKFSIQLDIPIGAKILGIDYRVEVALDLNWDADFEGGLITGILDDIYPTLNTKGTAFLDANAASILTDDSHQTDLVIFTNLGGNFGVQGRIRVTAFYEIINPMADFGT
jgi:hypothetical protein